MYSNAQLPTYPVETAFVYRKWIKYIKNGGKSKVPRHFYHASCKSCRSVNDIDGSRRDVVEAQMHSWMLEHVALCIPKKPGKYK